MPQSLILVHLLTHFDEFGQYCRWFMHFVSRLEIQVISRIQHLYFEQMGNIKIYFKFVFMYGVWFLRFNLVFSLMALKPRREMLETREILYYMV
jgi:hypothetical protein